MVVTRCDSHTNYGVDSLRSATVPKATKYLVQGLPASDAVVAISRQFPSSRPQRLTLTSILAQSRSAVTSVSL